MPLMGNGEKKGSKRHEAVTTVWIKIFHGTCSNSFPLKDAWFMAQEKISLYISSLLPSLSPNPLFKLG